MVTQHWLITYEWCDSLNNGPWMRENICIKMCPGLWWSNFYSSMIKNGKGEEDFRFLFATPISKEGFEALGDKDIAT